LFVYVSQISSFRMHWLLTNKQSVRNLTALVRSVQKWSASFKTQSITMTRTRLFGKASLHSWSNRETSQSVTWKKRAKSSKALSSSYKKSKLTARAKMTSPIS